ncbi:MAG: SIS domain-containing protein [Patescibacteria group bacterium]|jgi:glucose/mannose-6-phosphate isomerase
MQANLDSINEIKRLDSMNMAGSIEKLSNQIKQVHDEVRKIKIPGNYKKFKNIIFLGMGGSTLGAHVIRSVYENELQIPLEVVNGYDIPGTLTKDTLVFAVSYSGSTEETLSALEKARKRKAKIIIITSNGELSKISQKNKIPALIFGTQNNPCGSPRMGLGYTIFGPLLLLIRLKQVKLSGITLDKVVNTAKKYQKLFGPKNGEQKNLAKQFASALLRGPVWYVGSAHLAGSVHVAANQLNENSKRFGGYFLIPELNHHLLEGLTFPAGENETFAFIESDLYDKRVQKRYQVTKNILVRHAKQFLTYRCKEKNKLLETIEVLVFSSYLSFYTAIIEGIDPTAIPTVDFLKLALKTK